MAGYKEITFHEDSRAFTWSPASRKVYVKGGGLVAGSCYNMKQAREAARSFLNARRRG